jgi:DNA-binding GntR family transcriptional regulator
MKKGKNQPHGSAEPANGDTRTAALPDGKQRPRAQTRSQDLAQLLESEILGGAMLPGARLDEQTLATKFGVSRTPVREALRQLASSGLVEIRAHQGAVVKQLTLTELLEMFQVMAELEGLSARLAARRIGKEELEALRASHEACQRHSQAGDKDGFFDENNHLHDIILTASRNRFLIQKVQELRRRVNPYRRYVTNQPGVMEKSVDEHASFIAAIESGDGTAAHDLMRSHLNMLGGEAGDFIAILSLMDSSVEHQTERHKKPMRAIEPTKQVPTAHSPRARSQTSERI